MSANRTPASLDFDSVLSALLRMEMPPEARLFVDRRVPITPLPIVIEHLGDEGRRLWLEATVRQEFRDFALS